MTVRISSRRARAELDRLQAAYLEALAALREAHDEIVTAASAGVLADDQATRLEIATEVASRWFAADVALTRVGGTRRWVIDSTMAEVTDMLSRVHTAGVPPEDAAHLAWVRAQRLDAANDLVRAERALCSHLAAAAARYLGDSWTVLEQRLVALRDATFHGGDTQSAADYAQAHWAVESILVVEEDLGPDADLEATMASRLAALADAQERYAGLSVRAPTVELAYGQEKP